MPRRPSASTSTSPSCACRAKSKRLAADAHDASDAVAADARHGRHAACVCAGRLHGPTDPTRRLVGSHADAAADDATHAAARTRPPHAYERLAATCNLSLNATPFMLLHFITVHAFAMTLSDTLLTLNYNRHQDDRHETNPMMMRMPGGTSDHHHGPHYGKARPWACR